ncbi:bacteriophage abortive infection AbiH family protein [Ancylomarina sp. DW003]|nr:bacteriophage abortive infection AbiH family protein [Ancylomarina sp. DW003]MDE5420617.1 bacteriophage abortive infection AbiH family protein [Ancylomarina sp. DW003]
MEKLFIIGNGFDLAHDIKSSYDNFRQYLEDKYPNMNRNIHSVPEATLMPDGGEVFDDDEVVGFLINVISNIKGNDWRDFETALGLLEYHDFFDSLYEHIDKDGDPDQWKNAYQSEDLAESIIWPSSSVKSYFADWINTINISSGICKQNDFLRIIDSASDYFLTFNYTKTLESLYSVGSACHIHGQQGGEMLVGHGNDNFNSDDYQVGAGDSLLRAHSLLRKNTTKAIKRNSEFFNNISTSNITEIYSYGFSFSDVDSVYIKEICDKLPTHGIVWFFNDFDSPKKIDSYKEKLRSWGFKGTFDTYHIS